MQVYGMEPELVTIYNIRNLESVKLWDLESARGPKRTIIPAILITYDGGKHLNICATEKYFDIYVKKVAQVYKDEKNNILEDALTDPFRIHSRIDIDDFTKSVLESESLEQVSDIYSFYNGKESFDTSFFFQIDEVKSLVDILKYHMAKLFSFTNKVVLFNNSELTGFRNNYCLTGQVDGIETTFPIVYEKLDNNKYELWVGGILEQNQPINIRISFEKDCLLVEANIECYNLSSTFKYSITNGVVKKIHDIMKNGLTISYENEDLPEETSPDLLTFANIDEPTNLKWFRLPWGADYGIDTHLTDLSDFEKIIEIHNIYVSIFNCGFVKKENYSKRYKRNKTVSVDTRDLLVDEVQKSILGVSIDSEGKTFIIETAFNMDDADHILLNGVLNGEHYYHACHNPEGLKGLKKEQLVSLGKRHIITNSDLVNRHKILKLIKGE